MVQGEHLCSNKRTRVLLCCCSACCGHKHVSRWWWPCARQNRGRNEAREWHIDRVLGGGLLEGAIWYLCSQSFGQKWVKWSHLNLREIRNWFYSEYPDKHCIMAISSVQFSHSVMSDSLQLHEPQYARPPCPSPTHKVHTNSCPLSQWCHPAISFSAIPFSSGE